ncbi:MAG: alpha/beta fold hydrolase [Spirochaetes bacterium]|nr:alpha/beta fold hydrolase [Spirochaetota bacterium]
MKTTVYKSEEGRRIVEDRCRDILESFGTLPFRQRFVPTPFGSTHVLEFGGTGTPLVMLHGSISNSAVWLGVVRDFVDRFSVYCLDIPGEPGLSEPRRMALSGEEPARWLVSVMDGLGIPAAAFLAMSMGSWYALKLAVTEPGRVLALSMITAGGLARQRLGFLFRAAVCLMLGGWGKKKLSRMVYHRAEVPPEVLEYQDLVTSHFNPLMEPLPLLSDEELRRLAMPVQYFGGDRDVLLDTARSARRLRELLPRAEVHVLEDTGHVIVDRFIEARDFLAKSAAAHLRGSTSSGETYRPPKG